MRKAPRYRFSDSRPLPRYRYRSRVRTDDTVNYLLGAFVLSIPVAFLTGAALAYLYPLH